MVLLGLMVLALIIAAATHDGGSDVTSPAAESPATTPTTATTPGASGQGVIDQINDTLKSGTGLQFVVGKAELVAASAATLDQVAAILKTNATLKAEVRGFTDDQGDANKNQVLSQTRAQAVVDYLVQKGGITAGRLTANGLGETNFIGDNTTEAGRAKNRRVEFALA